LSTPEERRASCNRRFGRKPQFQ